MLMRVSGVLGIAALAAGCSQPSHLMHVHRTTMGVSMSGSTEGNGHFQVGYKQREFYVIPKSKFVIKDRDQATTDHEAMSIISCSSVEARWLGPVDFRQTLATGNAAVRYARDFDPTTNASPFRCFDTSNLPEE